MIFTNNAANSQIIKNLKIKSAKSTIFKTSLFIKILPALFRHYPGVRGLLSIANQQIYG